ncbi:hypothetical protein GCM10010971_26650 [Silvimonas amylolytica]|uniref:Anti-phage defense ZorAB system ZorA n=2 Tax=Silvimonas amylolytica TaxID=449663 RepID=A0ABQ2PN48_9NEIS|nr:hypothetical protein GCM10010971_26650 [Silvimonas amylolytica]
MAAPIVVAIFLVWFFVKYLKHYRIPAGRLARAIKQTTGKIDSVKDIEVSKRRAMLDQIFQETGFRHVWQEYQETLHDQHELHEGEVRVVRSRSTVPAAYFFSSQSLIDTPLRTEYFKHLPGVLTGIGIIGTFAGLLVGLFYFDPSDPARINDSVGLLLNGVRDAFIASALAILIAMYVTNSEKKHLRNCYAELEKLNEAIDRLFDAGVGEEYLAALVNASEENSKQTRQLKDSLVTDLREMLQNLVETQVRENIRLGETLSGSYKETGRDIASQISSSIEDSFRDPLNKIADSVQSASGDQSGKVQNLLQDVLVAFMAELKGTFGQQFSGLHEMLGQSVTSMQQMQTGFAALVEDMRSASESSSTAVHEQLSRTLQDMQSGQSLMQAAMNEMVTSLQKAVSSVGEHGESAGQKMAEQLEKLFTESESRQRAMSDQMQSFIDGIRDSVGQGQQDTMSRISATVEQLGQNMQGMLSTFENNRMQMDSAAKSAQDHLHEGTRSLVTGLNEQVKSLLETLTTERTATDQTIQRLMEHTERSLNGMQAGADKMRLAAERIEAAGDRVSQTTLASSQLVQQVQGVSNELNGASRELSTVLADYRANRDAIQGTLSALEGVIANAQAEAGMRGQITQDLKTVNDRMHELNQEASSYVDRVTDVLGKGFDEFGAGVERSLSKSLGSLDAELDKAVKALAGGVDVLTENIEDLAETVQKTSRTRQH